ncbi:MAG: hypothetical protein KGQ48_08150 [Bradyrhizobium sp.]|nr:hypothetical protein [Bradyrhizobium sp.]
MCAIAIVGTAAATAKAETPDEWITLGTRVHGGFGSFVPVGIRIGLYALQRLNAKPRAVTVLYYDSDKAPCACLADGVAIATVATVGQRTLRIAPERAPEGAMAVIIILTSRRSRPLDTPWPIVGFLSWPSGIEHWTHAVAMTW